jgi:DNA-directed RNA polymerase subunit N (RpoN/RPB10)
VRDASFLPVLGCGSCGRLEGRETREYEETVSDRESLLEVFRGLSGVLAEM